MTLIWPAPEVYLLLERRQIQRGQALVTAGFDLETDMFLTLQDKYWFHLKNPIYKFMYESLSFVILFQNPGSTIDCNATNFNFSILL